MKTCSLFALHMANTGTCHCRIQELQNSFSIRHRTILNIYCSKQKFIRKEHFYCLSFSAIFSTFLHRKIGCRHAKERSGATEENDFPFPPPRGEFKASSSSFPLALLLKKVRETVKEEKWEKKKSCFLLSPPFPTLSPLQKVKGKRRRVLKLKKNTEKGLRLFSQTKMPPYTEGVSISRTYEICPHRVCSPPYVRG